MAINNGYKQLLFVIMYIYIIYIFYAVI